MTTLTDDVPGAVGATTTRPARRLRLLWTAGLATALGISVLLSLTVGANPLSLGQTYAELTGGGTDETRYIVWDLRVPRTVTGLVVGAALGVAGALIQAFARNPLADPGILGVNAGAAFFVSISVALLGVGSVSGYVWFAFVGALVVTLAVYVIGDSGRGGVDPSRLTLSGVALGAVLSGITTGITLSDPDSFDQMRSWNAGTLLGRGFDVLVPVLPFVAVGLILALLISPALNSVALGDDHARAQGVNVPAVRLVVVIAVTLLAGAATALSGPITFVGLMVPHVIRWIFGPDQRIIITASVVFSPVLLLMSDVIGRLVVLPSEMPVGIVTAFVGAPVLVVLVRQRKASKL